MSDIEETEYVAEAVELQDESDDGDDTAMEPAEDEPEKEEQPAEKGLMGEIMDLVRSGSPQDKGAILEVNEPTVPVVQEDPSEPKEDENEQPTANEAEESEDKKESNEEKEEKDNNKEEEEEEEVKSKKEKEGQAAIDTVEEPMVEEDEQIMEEIVTPHFLSDEDIIAKGVAESDIGMYRKFYLKLSYSPKAWHDLIKDHTFTTEFIVLSAEEISALLAVYHSPNEEAPSVTDEVKAVIAQLQEKIDGIISQYGEDGGFVKINTHSAKDAILDRCDQDHIQAVEDGVQNELEIEQQFVNAYLNWRSWRSMSYRENSRTKLPSEQRGRNNVVRRSFRRIQKSFNRPRANTTGEQPTSRNNESKAEDTPLAEETAKDEKKEESKEENKDGEETKSDDKKEGNDEGETDKEADKEATVKDVVTVEATVEKTEVADSGAEEDQSKEVASDDKQDEKKEEKTEAKEETPMEDEEKQAKPEKEAQTGEETKEAEIEEVKPKEEEEVKPKEEEVKSNEEASRVPPPMLGKEHQFIKVKSETRGNRVLRAFIKATTGMYRVTSGEKAIELLSTSRIIKEDLEEAKVFANITGANATLSVQRWHGDVARYPGMQFRAFVYKSKLNALSQKDDVAYIPNIVRYKDTIKTKIVHFFNSKVKESLKELDSYIIDIFVGTNKVYITDMNPFCTGTGACLFTWQQNKKVMLNGPLIFRHIPTPYKNCFTGLQPHWQQVCINSQQKKATKEPSSGKCLIL